MRRLEELSGRTFGVGAQPLLVAVRSGAAESMPGMMDTVLNVGLDPSTAWADLLASITAVFRSWNSERAVAYRKHHKVDGLLGTAVTVQMMCPAEVAGVMFTANPVNRADEIIIESAFGLGEAIVLGKVTPDRFVLDKHSLALNESAIVNLHASLSDEKLQLLGRLGQKVEAHFKTPCDIEWALADGKFYLLQSRAIKFKKSATVIDPQERERIRQEEIAKLQAAAAPGGTVWGRYNLAEILPEPTPMTWSIVRQFMSGRGGFGQMYRDLGFDPDPALDDIGTFDLIAGRPYCNLSRDPKMQFANMPFEHSFARLKANPSLALYPQATFNPRRAGFLFFVKAPLYFFRMWRTQIRQHQLTRTFADDFTKSIVPRYLAEIEKLEREDYSKLSAGELLHQLHEIIQLTLFDFARHSLKPTALAALMLANLERSFAMRLQPIHTPPAEAQAIGMQKAQSALRELMLGVQPDEATDVAHGFRAVREGRLSRADFLQGFGHRASQEMELARPRWSEDASAIESQLSPLAPTPGPSPAEERGENGWQFAWLKLADEARLLPSQRPAVETELRLLQTYMGLRETAKHHLLRGYAQIRRALGELDVRYELDDGIFFLSLDDLAELVKLAEGKAPQMYFDRIKKNKHRREIALSLPLPTVIFSDDLDAVGRELTLASVGVMQGAPLSAGVAEASAWVLEDPIGVHMPHEPYILVCPSTDPAWVPLFANACGLVMETGGMLSHGAIVAREFGLPAVAGIADVQRRIKTGQRLRIDGASGTVSVVE
jgi:pyruvate,water dikinase